MSDTFNFPFEKHLNNEQLEAVNAINGPVLVIAGAGSGKTRTLVFRLLNLIRLGINPESILLLTFTRKAAASMIERASELIGGICNNVFGGTFHAFSHLMLRRYHGYAGLNKDFTILDRSDVQDIFNLIVKQKGNDINKKNLADKRFLASLASRVANHNAGLLSLLETEFLHLLNDYELIKDILESYEEYKKNSALLDFDDLLVRWRDTLKNNPELQNLVSSHFKYIMVDEYQDTNTIQADIVRIVAGKDQNIMAVGDDSQSIYAFRGANFKNILEFPHIFPNCRIIKLEKNYRTTQPNLDCTNAIISCAKESFHKRLVAVRDGGNPPFYHFPFDELNQAGFVAERIKELLDKNVAPKEIAVLFRAGFHSYHLEAELAKHNIKYEKRGGLKLFEAAHIKDATALLKLTINPLEPLSLNRALMLVNKIGTKTVLSIYENLVSADDPLDLMANYETKAVWKESLRELGKILKIIRETHTSITDNFQMLDKWYFPNLMRLYPEDYHKRNRDLQQFYEMSAKYSDKVSFLSDISLDPPESLSSRHDNDSIILSTIHSAKGLEWKVVFIISLCEGKFPSQSSNYEEIEEERRLFYVASTRAKDVLFLLVPQSGANFPAIPSRFFQEIPIKLMNQWKGPQNELKRDVSVLKSNIGISSGHRAFSLKKPTLSGTDSGNNNAVLNSDSSKFKIGLNVSHQIFGHGIVTEIVSTEKIKVKFHNAGEKTLHVGYANLNILS